MPKRRKFSFENPYPSLPLDAECDMTLEPEYDENPMFWGLEPDVLEANLRRVRAYGRS